METSNIAARTTLFLVSSPSGPLAVRQTHLDLYTQSRSAILLFGANAFSNANLSRRAAKQARVLSADQNTIARRTVSGSPSQVLEECLLQSHMVFVCGGRQIYRRYDAFAGRAVAIRFLTPHLSPGKVTEELDDGYVLDTKWTLGSTSATYDCPKLGKYVVETYLKHDDD